MQKISILGAGESGVGAAVLAKKQGYEVFVSDKNLIKPIYKNVLLHHEISFEEGKHSENAILKSDLIIKSPGIPDDNALIINAKSKGIGVISEIEFAAKFTQAKKICITGSNGKTTTTLLIYHMLKKAGYNVGLAGNVGKSFALQVASEKFDYYVLEISSFQLDGMFEFKADIAILLNITPDHLDRYGYDFNKYFESKFRILRNQCPTDTFIYCYDDDTIRNQIEKTKIESQQIPFSIKTYVHDGAFIENDQIIFNTKHAKSFKMKIEKLALQGKHNIYNSMASGITGRVLEIRKETIKESLSDFQNVEHRLEFVAKIRDVEFFNDSKATNVNSTWYAIESMNKPVIWIVGGLDKGNDYEPLKEVVRQKVKAIVCLGLDNTKILKAFSHIISPIIETSNAEEAVNQAYQLGEPGDVVLLSPACASFDIFENYEDRGKRFKKAVAEL